MNRAGKPTILSAAFLQIAFLFCIFQVYAQDGPSTTYSKKDTLYNSAADSKIINMLKKGKAPKVTLQLNFNYDIGHLDLAGNENTHFSKIDFESGSNFGTRYGYGGSLTGKFALHKAGNVRLNVTAAFHRFQSNFVISESPDGKVYYNALSGALGLENSFTPDRKFKPYLGADIVISIISGKATLKTDSTDFVLTIKSATRIGASFNMGFEYAFSNKVGLSLGYKLTYANLIGRQTKASTNPNEAYLNDDKVTSGDPILFAGWKQFVYSSFSAGINFYFGMKNKK